MLCNLFEQSRIRGLHSCGYSFLDGKVINTRKFFDTDELKHSLMPFAKSHLGKPLKIIGHTRYSTSGDWEDHRNNQPLHVVGPDKHEISLVFNGCIHMGLRTEYEQAYGKKYTTDNDGEIFCRKVLDGEDWHGFVDDGSFSFAGAFLHKGQMHAIRNRNRPLWFGYSLRAIFIASTEDIFRRAEFDGEVEEVEPCMSHRIS